MPPITVENRDAYTHVKTSSGCYVSTLVGFVLVLLAAAIAVGVGVIVHLAGGNREIICRCEPISTGGATAEAVIQKCVEMARSGKEEICLKCPATTTNSSPSVIIPGTTRPSEYIRLPTSIKPIHYDIELQLYLIGSDPKNFKFKGHVKIQILCVKETDKVTLHADILTVIQESIRFRGVESSGSDPVFTKSSDDANAQFFTVHLNKNMEAGKTYFVEMSFTSPMSRNLKGLYYTSDVIDGRPVYLATTQFEATYARMAFPCFDEPAMKATFNLSLVRPQHLISISNMPIRNSTQAITEEGVTYIRDIFEKTPIMSTYLMAFAVCDYKHYSRISKNGILFRTWATPRAVNHTRYSLDLGVDILTYFEGYFNISYPLPKEDMIAFPQFAFGAMENWGLITYKESAMLYREGITKDAAKEQVAETVAHEIGHQWFGNLVTPAWWEDLWLSEGFASYLEHLGVDYVHSDWGMWNMFVVEKVQVAMDGDDTPLSLPLRHSVVSNREIEALFSSVTYKKGASIVRMMSHFLGEDTFRKGIIRYLEGKAFGVVSQDDLWVALNAQVLEDGKSIEVKDIMETWTLQRNYPLVTVRWSPTSPESVHVTQKRFLRNKPGSTSSGYKWTIPITFTTSVNTNFQQTDRDVHWLGRSQESATFTVEPLGTSRDTSTKGSEGNTTKPWILANVNRVGFYRVNYERENWDALAEQLNRDHKMIPVTSRAMLIDDACKLAKGNYLSWDVAINMMVYLDKEVEYIPWLTADNAITNAREVINLDDIEIFMQSKLTSPYEFHRRKNNSATHEQRIARQLITSLACKWNVPDCLEDAHTEFKHWRNSQGENRLDPNFEETFLNYGMVTGDEEDWEFLLNKSETARSNSEKSLILTAMSYSNNTDLLRKTLQLILNSNSSVPLKDARVMLKNVISKPKGQSLAWEILINRIEELERKNGMQTKIVSESFSTILDQRSELSHV